MLRFSETTLTKSAQIPAVTLFLEKQNKDRTVYEDPWKMEILQQINERKLVKLVWRYFNTLDIVYFPPSDKFQIEFPGRDALSLIRKPILVGSIQELQQLTAKNTSELTEEEHRCIQLLVDALFVAT